MNINDPKSSKDPEQSAQKIPEKKEEELFIPVTPPLASPSEPISSPNEPTHAYPADSAHTYSSNPAQYSYPNKPTADDISKANESKPFEDQIHEEIKSSESSFQREKEKLKEHAENFKNKAHDTFSHIRDSKNVNDIYNLAFSNKEQTVTYILLALGLFFLLFFNNMLGGLLIGMVAGYYFASEIIYYLRNMSQIINGHDQLRYAVLTSLLLGLFIAAPGIFIGAAIVAAFKQVMAGPRDPV